MAIRKMQTIPMSLQARVLLYMQARPGLHVHFREIGADLGIPQAKWGTISTTLGRLASDESIPLWRAAGGVYVYGEGVELEDPPVQEVEEPSYAEERPPARVQRGRQPAETAETPPWAAPVPPPARNSPPATEEPVFFRQISVTQGGVPILQSPDGVFGVFQPL
jgi:hypothetical protein